MNLTSRPSLLRIVLLLLVLCGYSNDLASANDKPLNQQPGLITREFIYERAPFPECHASTIAETADRLVAAWFGGTEEKHNDVGIWFAWKDKRQAAASWSAPVEVATGVVAAATAGGKPRRYPCWNPVLFQPAKGPLLLFYKVGPDPKEWWGMLISSDDQGRTWSSPRRLPEGILGPIKNKPIQLANGDLLCPSSTEHDGWKVHFERTSDLGTTWTRTPDLSSPAFLALQKTRKNEHAGIIQPTILRLKDGSLSALCRSGEQRIIETRSTDQGRSWSPPVAGPLPNPDSGIDGVTLADGRHLLVYNPTTTGRTPLVLAASKDGKNWNDVLTLENEPGEYSYPAIIQTSDGLVHITYTWRRERIRYVAVDPTRLPAGKPASSKK